MCVVVVLAPRFLFWPSSLVAFVRKKATESSTTETIHTFEGEVLLFSSSIRQLDVCSRKSFCISTALCTLSTMGTVNLHSILEDEFV